MGFKPTEISPFESSNARWMDGPLESTTAFCTTRVDLTRIYIRFSSLFWLPVFVATARFGTLLRGTRAGPFWTFPAHIDLMKLKVTGFRTVPRVGQGVTLSTQMTAVDQRVVGTCQVRRTPCAQEKKCVELL